MDSQLFQTRVEQIIAARQSTTDLSAALKYTLLAGGKRVRARLFFSLSTDLKLEDKFLYDLAIAIEMLHSASLVHDDLPALDNDDFRRGKPSCHKEFGEATAILCGDTLVAQAFEVVSEAEIPERCIAGVVQTLSAAFVDLCYGQQMDLGSAKVEELERLLEIHRLKTGRLFEAICKLVFLLSECQELNVDVMVGLGAVLGEYFQLCDDIIDIHGSSEDRGRPESSDLKNGRKNRVLGLSKEERLKECVLLESQIEGILLKVEEAAQKYLHSTRELYFELKTRVRAASN